MRQGDQYNVSVYPPDLILNTDAVCRRFMCSPVVLVASKLTSLVSILPVAI
jgi:hypothetical protein